MKTFEVVLEDGQDNFTVAADRFEVMTDRTVNFFVGMLIVCALNTHAWNHIIEAPDD